MKKIVEKSTFIIHQSIFNQIEKINVVDQFLSFKNCLIFDDDEMNLSEDELFNYMIKNKHLAQVSLNLYNNSKFYQKFEILESYKERDSTLIQNEKNLVDYVTKYLLSYIALERLELQKHLRDITSLIKKDCFYCESSLVEKRCQVCSSSSFDMREYAQIHFQTLMKEKKEIKENKTSFFEDIISEDNSIEGSIFDPDDSLPTDDQTLISTQTFQIPKNYWVCELCTFSNTSEAVNCAVCYNNQVKDLNICSYKNDPKEDVDNEENKNEELVCLFSKDNCNEYKEVKGSCVKKNVNEEEKLDPLNIKCVKNSKGSVAQKASVRRTWQCWNPKCYFINDYGHKYCIKCGFQRLISRSFIKIENKYIITLWMCDICSAVNDDKIIICINCEKGKKYGCTKFWDRF